MEQETQEDTGPLALTSNQPGFQPLGAEPGRQWGIEGFPWGDSWAVSRLRQWSPVPHAPLGTTQAIGLFTAVGQSRLRGSPGALSAAFPGHQ